MILLAKVSNILRLCDRFVARTNPNSVAKQPRCGRRGVNIIIAETRQDHRTGWCKYIYTAKDFIVLLCVPLQSRATASETPLWKMTESTQPALTAMASPPALHISNKRAATSPPDADSPSLGLHKPREDGPMAALRAWLGAWVASGIPTVARFQRACGVTAAGYVREHASIMTYRAH